MTKTTREREDDARGARHEHMQEQISSGELVVRKMTAAERRKWDQHSAASDREATPDERARRKAALQKRRARDERAH